MRFLAQTFPAKRKKVGATIERPTILALADKLPLARHLTFWFGVEDSGMWEGLKGQIRMRHT